VPAAPAAEEQPLGETDRCRKKGQPLQRAPSDHSSPAARTRRRGDWI